MSEAVQFFESELCQRWPDWHPTPAQTADWIEWLAPLDWQATLTAVRKHAAVSRFKAPIAAAILDASRAAAPPRQTSPRGGFVTLTAEYLGGCTQKQMNPGRRFECVPCVNNRPIRPDDTAALARAGQHWLRHLQTLYPGGRFELKPVG